jgi:hypothetical protein
MTAGQVVAELFIGLVLSGLCIPLALGTKSNRLLAFGITCAAVCVISITQIMIFFDARDRLF